MHFEMDKEHFAKKNTKPLYAKIRYTKPAIITFLSFNKYLIL